ncbi:MAG: Holliday junction branch migration protein RuvA [Bacteroidia bacterium]|nr:Holliday junction branch migration protein RuvA [Bacteroidia bacterium]
MIAFVSGKLIEVEPTHAIVECGEIGYLVKISLNTFNGIKEKKDVKLHTHFLVREDSQQLYGFESPQEKQLFEQLIGISGVGGNTALMILSSISAEDLYHAIRSEDSLALTRVKGIGAKTAARIILELKDKIKLAEGSAGSAVAGGGGQKKAEALTALTNLGLNKATMIKRVDKILKDNGSDISVAEIIKLALRNPS